MKSLGSLAATAAAGVRIKKKRPQVKRIEATEAARSRMAPLGVFSTKVFKAEAILQDRNAILVYMAICMHAKKNGITECSQDRLSAITGASLRTVARKIQKLQQYGLIKKEYSRPIRGNPMHRLNIMRVIYDGLDMTRQDVQSIAGKEAAVTSQTNVARIPGSYPQATQPDMPNTSTETGAVTCHIDLARNPGHANQSLQLHAKTASQVTSQTTVALKQAKALNNRDIVECMNKALIRFNHKPIETTDSDLQAINGTSLTEQDVTGAVADYLLECQESRQAAQPSIMAILGHVLQAH